MADDDNILIELDVNGLAHEYTSCERFARATAEIENVSDPSFDHNKAAPDMSQVLRLKVIEKGNEHGIPNLTLDTLKKEYIFADYMAAVNGFVVKFLPSLAPIIFDLVTFNGKTAEHYNGARVTYVLNIVEYNGPTTRAPQKIRTSDVANISHTHLQATRSDHSSVELTNLSAGVQLYHIPSSSYMPTLVLPCPETAHVNGDVMWFEAKQPKGDATPPST